MTSPAHSSPANRKMNRTLLIVGGIIAVVLAALGGWIAGRTTGVGSVASLEQRTVERMVREYILANPEIIPEAMDNLQRKQSGAALADVKGEVTTPFTGAVLGNPQGSVTLVEFSDYACGYCRQSVEEVKALLAERPDLRVVVREMPILSDDSALAARMALAAAEQGKYEAFHNAMVAIGRPSAETVQAAARQAGVDLERARIFMESPDVEAELKRNMELAQQLGFNGTPSWVVGDQTIAGAVGADVLSEAIAKAQS